MDLIKEAFLKIKEEIFNIKNEIIIIKQKIEEIEQNQFKNQKNSTIDQILYTNINQPTHQPTHQPTQNQIKNTQNELTSEQNIYIPNNLSEFKKASEIINSLDILKKEIRYKFKRLTTQEMVIFSKLYTLEEQGLNEITYKLIASELKLSESSIRDYINKLIKKGIPIEKLKQNNKIITLKISKDLKNIATLATIIQLRGI
ncbi:MAG: HTH domain-containing protein [Nanoarchaeota archaeon]|nr:HTH domain-containing protein [Nanoarchaeota archaeon]